MLLSRIGKLLRQLKSRQGFTLLEASTVVGITAVLAITAVPIASEKIQDSKISTATNTTVAIGTSIVKFVGDTGIFPIARNSDSFTKGHLQTGASFKVKVLRSGLGEKGDLNIGDSDVKLDPGLDLDFNSHLSLWTPADSIDISNLNRHLVTDDIGYSQGSITWLGPYTPAIDQDPWGQNYLVYVNALNLENFNPISTTILTLVPQVEINGVRKRVYGWILSAGPDEKLQTAPTDSIIRGDDTGTLLAVPAQVPGTGKK